VTDLVSHPYKPTCTITSQSRACWFVCRNFRIWGQTAQKAKSVR
jgi:hypothetical protein